MRLRPAVMGLAGLAVAGCSSDRLVSDTSLETVRPTANASTPVLDDPVTVSPYLAQLDAALAASGSNLRIAKAELLIDGSQADATSLTLVANDRARGIGARWVPGDPRRNGRTGITYAFDPRNAGPVARNVNGNPAIRVLPFAEIEPLLEEGMASWRNQQCASAPISRVAVPTGGDPDLLDQLVLGNDGPRPYQPVSDLVQGGWQPTAFFTGIAGQAGLNILGVAFTFWYVDGNGDPTDIDRDGNLDTGLVEIYFSSRFLWATDGGQGVDFYSVIAHETGHGMGLAHFGKVFVTRKDAADGLQVVDVKYAPKSLMNASYIAGRNEITGTDRSSFCQIWSAFR